MHEALLPFVVPGKENKASLPIDRQVARHLNVWGAQDSC
jgi:hypothetical protein